MNRLPHVEVLSLDLPLPEENGFVRTRVEHIFPSSDELPENLLRFYLSFSNPMARGRVEEHIILLGPDGRPALDTLYRPPIELWDRSIRHLTILLDPGRLKRRVGPNRELGPPLKVGQEYRLIVDSGMKDFSGRPLAESRSKSFRITEAVREPIAVEEWKTRPPAANRREPLTLEFPRPLDWALLWRGITIASEAGQWIDGRIAIDEGERRWRFTPAHPWTAGSYRVRVSTSLEDVCGNTLLAAFDSPLRAVIDSGRKLTARSIPFCLV